MIIPKYTKFNRWANQLRIDYPDDIIPVAPSSEEHWKSWANTTIGSPSFAKANVPAPTDEKNWQEWVRKFHKATEV